MSECGCIYDGGADYGAEVSLTRMRTARKPTKCGECREAIVPGQRYELTTGRWEADWCSFKTCEPCVEIRTALFCEGFTYTAMWEGVSDYIAGGGKVLPCVTKLASVAAKEKLTALAYRL